MARARIRQAMIGDATVARWVARWATLREARARNEYEIARFASELRAACASELEFLHLVRTHLSGARGATLLRKAHAFREWSEADWRRLGGWPGLSFLDALTRPQRSEVMRALVGAGPYDASALRRVARGLGIDTPLGEERSRPRRELVALRDWLVELYRRRPDLPPPPPQVRAVLDTPTLRAVAALQTATAAPVALPAIKRTRRAAA